MIKTTAHLKRYKQVAGLMWKHRADLARQLTAHAGFPAGESGAESSGSPEQLATDLEALGPTFVKIGQVMSGRPDILPEAYASALARLQDGVKPFRYSEVEQIVRSELGMPVSKAFRRFDHEPVAAASLGQVHRATLFDGSVVAVKVQRPGIRHQIAEDFEILGEISGFLDKHTDVGRRHRFGEVIAEFKAAIQNELNYEREAQNLIVIGKNLEEFESIVVPQPVLDHSTSCLLTMEFVEGTKVSDLGRGSRNGMDGGGLADELFRAYLKQVLVDGLFHADPHPGNVFVTHDGKLALLDFGMTGNTSPLMQEQLTKVILAVSDGKGEEAANVVLRMSEKTDELDQKEFRRRISHLVTSHLNDGLVHLNVGRLLMELSRDARESGLFVPSELSLLGKALLELDSVGRILDPEFAPNECIRTSAAKLVASRFRKEVTAPNMVGTLLEMKDFAVHLPSRVNRIMDAVANAELEVKVKATDAKVVVEGIEKVANRITNGILLASIIIGGALIMRVDTSWRIFGYPGLAMLCFLFGVAGAMFLIWRTTVHSRRGRAH